MSLEELYLLKENLELLANEKDPKTGYIVEDTVLKSSFNKQVLRDAISIVDYVIKHGINPDKKDKRKKQPFYISREDRDKIPVSESPIPISVFVHRINECIDDSKMKKLKAIQITSWLVKEGYLDIFEDKDGRQFKILTDKSATIGIFSEKRTSNYGRVYEVNLYNEESQNYLIDHLDDIIESSMILL